MVAGNTASAGGVTIFSDVQELNENTDTVSNASKLIYVLFPIPFNSTSDYPITPVRDDNFFKKIK